LSTTGREGKGRGRGRCVVVGRGMGRACPDRRPHKFTVCFAHKSTPLCAGPTLPDMKLGLIKPRSGQESENVTTGSIQSIRTTLDRTRLTDSNADRPASQPDTFGIRLTQSNRKERQFELGAQFEPGSPTKHRTTDPADFPSQLKSKHEQSLPSIFRSPSGSSSGRPLGKRRSTSCSVLAHRSRASCGAGEREGAGRGNMLWSLCSAGDAR